MSSRSAQNPDYDVVVVGLGPTGATLALLLSQCGLSVLVIEREREIYDLPRAVHFDDETMRVFQSVGIATKLAEKVRVNPGMRFVDEQGQILLDWPRPQTITAQGWFGSYRLHQPDLERLLRNALSENANCKIQLEYELVSFKQSNSDVLVTIRNARDDSQSCVSASYLVGCDGANSLTREQLGIQWQDYGFNERWLVVDVLLKKECPELGDHTIQYCHPETPMTYCRNPGRRRRWEMALNDNTSDQQALSTDFIWQSLSRWLDSTDAELERRAVYQFRSAIAEQWQVDRVLLAGDAIHLTPPFMGQGMCAGIRDVYNLAWKLGLAINNSADNQLLTTYETERKSHVRHYILKAIELGELINSIDPRPADSASPPSARTMGSLSPVLEKGIEAMLGLAETSDSGKLFDQPKLSTGVRLDDYVGYRAVLISRGTDAAGNSGLLELSAENHPELERSLDQFNADSVLVRPDRYVLGIGYTKQQTKTLRSTIFSGV